MPESKSGALPLGYTPIYWGERRVLNPRPPGPQSGAPPIELLSPYMLARLEGLEPPTHGLEGRCSIQLSYRRKCACVTFQAILERVMGIGPTQPAWKAGVLPLNYTRTSHNALRLYQIAFILSNKKRPLGKNYRFFCRFFCVHIFDAFFLLLT